MPFFTKKQKVQMRKRRRKLKPAVDKDGGVRDGNHGGDDDELAAMGGADTHPAMPPTKRQRLDRQIATSTTDTSTASQLQSPTIITIPPHLTGKEARKFRKDERRRLRQAGASSDGNLTFVVEGQERHENSNNSYPKKKKRSFPRINDLLQQQKEQERLLQEEAKRLESQGRIPDEIKSKYIGLDCEMVGIGTDGKQSALARVSMVDWHLTPILDTFVQVPSKVTDFRTFVSGVRAKDIQKKTAMDVVECRNRVAEILRKKILVGHALKNDLHALMLQHPKEDIRDTAKYRPFQRASGPNGGKWRPRKLRDLVQEHVGKAIQVEGESHDSVEDAQATMELFHRVRDSWEKELEAKQKKKKSRKGK